MQVAGVAGPSGAGKTSLLERLVPCLDVDRVATVKSIHHDMEPDEPGTDTYRHRTAGAASATGVTPSLTFEVRTGGSGAARRDVAEARALEALLVDRADDAVDVTLVEGFTRARIPTVLAGDIDPGAVGGPILGHVDRSDTASLVAAVSGTRAFPTPRSLLGAVDPGAGHAVAVISATVPIDDPVPWVGEDGGSLSAVGADIAGIDGVADVHAGCRPTVVPGADRARALLAVGAADRSTLDRCLGIARDGLTDVLGDGARIEERRRVVIPRRRP